MTETDIKNLEPNKTIWDDQIKGLHVRSLSSGAKSFLFYYRNKAGTQRRPKLGSYPSLSLSDARTAAKSLLAQLAAGVDPKEKWDAARAECTVNELFNKAWTEYWSQSRFKESRWQREVGYNFKNHIAPHFGSLKISELTSVMIRSWHKAYLESKPYAGNRSLEVLSRLYSFAEEEGLRPQGTNPCALVASHKEKQRERSASDDEVRQISTILERELTVNPCEAVFLITLMFTGARPRSLERALKSELSRIEHNGQVYGLLTFNGKTSEDTGQRERVLIPPHTLSLIDSLPPHKSDRLFGIRMPTAFWNRVRREAGIEDLWVRDWRRTFASIALGEGIVDNVMGELLNHRDYQTTKIYARLGHRARIGAIEKVSDKYKKIIGIGHKS